MKINRFYFYAFFIFSFGFIFSFLYSQGRSEKYFNFSMCDYSYNDIDLISENIGTIFRIGSNSSGIIAAIEMSEGYNIVLKKHETVDLKYGIDPDYRATIYQYSCNNNSTYKDMWQIVLLEDKSEKIHDFQIQFNFDGNKFLERKIPFDFRFFWSAESIKNALWEMTGIGTTSESVENLMRSLGLDLEAASMYEGVLTNRYSFSRDNDVLLRRMGYYEDILMLWYFDGKNELTTLTVR